MHGANNTGYTLGYMCGNLKILQRKDVFNINDPFLRDMQKGIIRDIMLI